MLKCNFFFFLFTIASLNILAQQPTWVLPKVAEPKFKAATFNITRYGAKADGYTLNMKAVQKAIDECSANGGGTVQVPGGKQSS